MDCIVFLTHNFNTEFINTLTKIDNDNDINNFEVIVLFDNSKSYDTNIDAKFKNIKIVKINRILSSYDHLGHTMYINYFKQNRNNIKKYNYIWIIENDVYFPDSMIKFINLHKPYNHDLLVSEYGIRSKQWPHTKKLRGFKNITSIGVLCVIMRFSQDLLYKLIDNIDINFSGFLEIVLPHICIEYNLSIQQFLPEMCGILTVNNNLPLLKLIRNDIQNNTKLYIENKIYHPIKM
jgi:hypothetical protein